MANREYLLRLELIIQKLKKKPASFLEIQDFLEYQSELLGYDLVVSKRTFQRDLRDIFSIYEIIIEYDRYLKAYALREELTSRQDRLLESLDLFHALNIMDKHADYIHFETRQAAGTEFLHEKYCTPYKPGVLYSFYTANFGRMRLRHVGEILWR